MRKKVLFLALTSMLMLLCIPLCAQEVVIAHIDDREEYVDLGLSVKWATCNVGATNPEEVGGLFAWGETITKTEYHEPESNQKRPHSDERRKHNYTIFSLPLDLKQRYPNDNITNNNSINTVPSGNTYSYRCR